LVVGRVSEDDPLASLLGRNLQRRFAPGLTSLFLDVAPALGHGPVDNGETDAHLPTRPDSQGLVVVALRPPQMMVDMQDVKGGRAAGTPHQADQDIQ
jgi:hypothetical protein